MKSKIGDVKIKEMNQRQFRAAAGRHGFEVTGWSLTDHEMGVTYPFIYSIGPKGIEVHYRAWLAGAIQQRERERRRRDREGSSGPRPDQQSDESGQAVNGQGDAEGGRSGQA